MKTNDEIMELHKKLITALAENEILKEDIKELEEYAIQLQNEIHELLEQFGE